MHVSVCIQKEHDMQSLDKSASMLWPLCDDRLAYTLWEMFILWSVVSKSIIIVTSHIFIKCN